MRTLFYTAAILLVVTGCRDDTQNPQPEKPLPATMASRTSAPKHANRAANQPLPTPVPSDVTYTIIKNDVVPGIKRTLEVRLSRKVSEEVLRSIATELKHSDPNTYKRTFIFYFLPDMTVGTGAWASTHFNPNFEVEILGLTSKQEGVLVHHLDPRPGVIGRWLDERQFVGNRITIVRENGKLFMENEYIDGSTGKNEMGVNASSKGKRFEDKEGNDFGEYFLIDRRGNLQFWDRDGLFYTAKKIK